MLRTNNRFRRDPRQMEEDEELWFNNDDEEVDELDQPLSDCYKLEPDFTDQLPSKKSKPLGNFINCLFLSYLLTIMFRTNRAQLF